MIKCPRCGFEQPRDRFCAKCGIVMENFVSKPTGYGPTPYILSALVLLISAGLYYRFFYSEHAIVPEKASAPRPLVAARVPTQPTQPTPQVPQASQPVPAQAVTTPPVEVATPSEKTEPTEFSVDFDLVTQDIMDRMSQEGEGKLEIGTYSVSVVPQFKAKYDALKSEEGFKQLGTESKSLTLSQPSMIFRGGKEPKRNEAIGLYVELTPQHLADRGMEFKVSLKRSLPELSGSDDIKVVSQDFDQTLVIPKGWGLIVAGLLPRKPLAEGEDKLYETNILQAFNDPAFQKGESEFLVVIVPQ